MFCTNLKNTFLICKNNVFLPYYQSYYSEKIEKIGLPIKIKSFACFEAVISSQAHRLVPVIWIMKFKVVVSIYIPMKIRRRNYCAIPQTAGCANLHNFTATPPCSSIATLIGKRIVPPIDTFQTLSL